MDIEVIWVRWQAKISEIRNFFARGAGHDYAQQSERIDYKANGLDKNPCQFRKSSTASVTFRQLSGGRPFDPATAYHRQAAPCTRTKHLITCRSQDDMHLLLLVPPPGLAHLPTQFAA